MKNTLKLAAFVACLLACCPILAFGQTVSGEMSGKEVRTGSEIWGYFAPAVIGSSEDLPLPTFSDYPFALPIGVDPLAYQKTGPPTHTVYLDDGSNSCPKAPSGCGIYSGYVGGPPLVLITPFVAKADRTNLDLITGRVGAVGWASTGADGAYWDVWVTHGSWFDNPQPWVWPDNYGATGFLVFHSDCVQTSPCSGTNDFGFNPRGRQVTSHGSMDVGMSPPVPNMGYRNRYGDGSYLGFPSLTWPIPITGTTGGGAYPVSNCAITTVPCPSANVTANAYNDLANMWSLSSSSNGEFGSGSIGAVIQMGPADTAHSTGTCYLGPCPDDGVNHIVVQDAHIFPDAAGLAGGIIPLDISASEWALNTNPSPLIAAYAIAAPHDIFFSEDLFTSDTDEDGFSSTAIATFVHLGCANCGITHSALYGDSRNAGEGHGIGFAPPGPMIFDDNRWEGNSIVVWGGGGGTPPVCVDGNPLDSGYTCASAMLTGNVARARNHLEYNPRWLPAQSGTGHGGIQGDSNSVLSWTFSAGVVTFTVKRSLGDETGGNIYNPVVFVEKSPTGLVGLTVPQWYTATSFLCNGTACSHANQTAPFTLTIACSGCSGSGGSGGTGGLGNPDAQMYGYEALTGGAQTLSVTSAAAMNALSCGNAAYGFFEQPCDPIIQQNPIFKNLTERKETYNSWTDGELWENSGLDAQEGQCSSDSIRACSGVSKCWDGSSEDIHDVFLSNTVCRHSNQGLLHDGRSQNGGWSCWSDPSNSTCYTPSVPLSSVSCDAVFNNVIDFTFSVPVPIANADESVKPSKFTIANGYPAAQLMTGTDTYLYGVGSDLAALGFPDGWYQTENISFANVIPVYLPVGETCTPSTENIASISSGGLVTLSAAMPSAPAAGSFVALFSGTGDPLDTGTYTVQASPAPTTTTFTLLSMTACASACGQATKAYTNQATLVSRTSGAGSGSGVTPGMHHAVTNNFLLYDQGNHQNWNGSTNPPSIVDSPGGHIYSVYAVMGPASGTPCTSLGLAAGTINTGVACIQTVTIDSCAAATYGTIPECPRLLQAETGDLMNIVCSPTNAPAHCSIFATATGIAPSPCPGLCGGDPGTEGSAIIDLDPGQRWFTYVPPGYSSGNAGIHTTIPLEPPNGFGIPEDYGSSGLYGTESYPKGMYYNHLTIVGMNGADVSGGSFQTNLTFKNLILAVPGTGDTGVPGVPGGVQVCGGSVRCGFAVPGSDPYTGPAPPGTTTCTGGGTAAFCAANPASCNTTGITNMGDPPTLNFLDNVVVGRTLTNYPIWTANAPGCSNDGYLTHENTTPPRTSTPGSTVTCGGTTCDTATYCLAHPTTCKDAPDSIGFSGAMSTNQYPLDLPDFRSYALDPSSPYHAGNALQADDGLDSGWISPFFLNANARTILPVLGFTSYGVTPTYYHDGPQYAWITWTGDGHTPYTIYEDGVCVPIASGCLTTSNAFIQVYGLIIGSTHAWVVKDGLGTTITNTAVIY